MLKKLHILLLTVLAALCCTAIAWADYDYIDRYDVDVLPNTDDGSLTITVSLTWTGARCCRSGRSSPGWSRWGCRPSAPARRAAPPAPSP